MQLIWHSYHTYPASLLVEMGLEVYTVANSHTSGAWHLTETTRAITVQFPGDNDGIDRGSKRNRE